MVQAIAQGHRVPAVLHPPHASQAGTQETQDRGTLGRTLQETQHRHGEQDHAVAAQDRRTGTTFHTEMLGLIVPHSKVQLI